MKLQESGEMYLETILVLAKKLPVVRAIDIGEEMGYSKPSVSRAMGLLKTGGYITIGADGGILLTDCGRELAAKIYDRHTVLTRCLEKLGVDHATATADACKIEHSISDTSFAAIKQFVSD